MKAFLRTTFSAAALIAALALPAAALAQQRVPSGGSHSQGGGTRRGIPEFDLAAVGAVAAVIAGGGIMLARRRKS